jgi:hypothetical protein
MSSIYSNILYVPVRNKPREKVLVSPAWRGFLMLNDI